MNPPTKLHLGAAYYPEHWTEDRWAEDIRLMQEAGLTVVRMGEFAWSTFESAEGQFNFEWMDRAINMLSVNGIDTVMGTPTAAPPAWLVQRYPDTLAVESSGRRVQFGNRCHYCVTSPEFHLRTRQIVRAMAEHYGQNPLVVGWQLDNEYNRPCCCERCQAQFQQFLKEKYVTLDALNQHWSTAYWSQTYSDWAQIPLPIGGHNPGLMMEYKRFLTACYRQFQKIQLDELRPHLHENAWVTHNFMGWYDGFDHYEIAADLDIATWDWYIGQGHNNHLSTTAVHDLTRGFKQKNHWVMETQPGTVNWARVNTALNKGEGRTMAYEALAAGADGFLYWQWRSALNGQEQYHGSLVDQSGQPRLFYAEVKQLGQEYKQLSSLVAGSTVKSRIAMLNDYESRWSVQWQKHHADFDWVAHFNAYYMPLTARNYNVDIISARGVQTSQQLTPGYKLIIAPAMVMLHPSLVTPLTDFCRRGGHLVLTARCGMKDEYNAMLSKRQPGPLSSLAGVEVEEYFALAEPVPVKGNWFEGKSLQWAERLKILNGDHVQVIARYGKYNGWLDEQPAITVTSFGSGLVYYVGTYLDPAAQLLLIERFARSASLAVPIGTPDGVQVRTRTTPQGEEIYFVINHTNTEKALILFWLAYEHITLAKVPAGEVKIPPYGIMVLTKYKDQV